MASRPVFMPHDGKGPGVTVVTVPFTWHAGHAPVQKRRNVDALHAAFLAAHTGAPRPLEISRRSAEPLGVALSAFNLGTPSARSGGVVCVESLYQASKVFDKGGPFPEWYGRPAREVRKLVAAQAGVDAILTAFDLHGVRWPLLPRWAFYAWVYCHALHRNPDLVEALDRYGAFTDIEFNPKRSVNCQAQAAAFYLSLARCGRLKEALSCREAFLTCARAAEAAGGREPAGKAPAEGKKARPRRTDRRRQSAGTVRAEPSPGLDLFGAFFAGVDDDRE